MTDNYPPGVSGLEPYFEDHTPEGERDEPPAPDPDDWQADQQAAAVTTAIDAHLDGPPVARVEVPAPVYDAAREYADGRDGTDVETVLFNHAGLQFDVRPVGGDEGGR